MSVRRYFGANNRDAMRQVRESLGPEAMILSSRQLDDGYEILAMAEDALDAKVAEAENPPPNDFAALAQRLLSEVQEMRSMLNKQQKKETPAIHPIREMVNILQAAGFGTELIRELATVMPKQCTDVSAWLHEQLQQRIQLPNFPAELFTDGVIALVGPTGVGKTTTTAKLAAHYVMQFGPEQLLLVTTDGYRVGAREQLKIYAGLLDVDMHALEEGEKLDTLQDKMRGKKLVLIDTVGMSQRDQRLTQRIADLQTGTQSATKTRLVLLLNSASQRESLDEVVQLFQQMAKQTDMVINDCIISKVDESVRLGGAIDVLIRHGLVLHFVSNGQRVPEDLELPDMPTLISLALNSVAAEYAEFSQWLANYNTETATSGRATSSTLQAQGKTLASLYEQLRKDLPGFANLEELLSVADAPAEQQAFGLEQWQQKTNALAVNIKPLVMHWARPKPVAGVKWHLANLPGNAEGLLLPLPLNAAEPRDISGISKQLELQQHIFQLLPVEKELDWLQEKQWVSVINRNQRVYISSAKKNDQRVAALALRQKMHKVAVSQLPYRGEAAKLSLGYTLVRLSSNGNDYKLWYGELNASKRNADLVRRFWLTSATLSEESAKGLIIKQLLGDEAASLTRQAFGLLQQAGYDHLPQDVLVALATSLAASAIHVEHSMVPAFNTARQRLLSLPGKRGKANAQKILAGLIHLLEATAAMQIMSAAGVRSE
ncbi:flagellar biosynthetic protein FlhF [Idiomarina sp. A28L]|uniref:flagellar biosynthesis protein FlhF n=1 Tax=Idiomarina sp. A28L TaxID=1036674 RepID=UPI0002138BEC|nr:flagellar biosynthesis protein FlhF [Idiomarina sp. A28L]EGN75960.1 flagellar biosynthetic protein FlhF [Idiomarina sp. A28L]